MKNKSDYKAQYLDPRWQKKRLEIMQRDEFMCQYCGDKDSTLHVHHRIYKQDRKLWEYSGNELITLCDACHTIEHQNFNKYSEFIDLIKTKFWSWDIENLYCAFLNSNFRYPSEVVSDIIKFAFESEEICELLENKFFESLRNKINEVSNV